MMKKVLMIVYYFPPVLSSGTFRSLRFTKYLPQNNWEPIILTIKKDFYEDFRKFDDELKNDLPESVKVYRTSMIRGFTPLIQLKNKYFNRKKVSLKQNDDPKRFQIIKKTLHNLVDHFMSLFLIPDQQVGWLFFGVVRGCYLVFKEKIDIIYSSGAPWTSHLIGVIVKKVTRRPLVLDFRDPWISNPYNQLNGIRLKSGTYLESLSVKNADYLITNTEYLEEDFKRRYRELKRIKTIYNGYDPLLFEKLNKHILTVKRDSRFIITHVGTIYLNRYPELFFEGVKKLLLESDINRGNLLIRFVGLIENERKFRELICKYNLTDLIEIIGEVSHKTALEYQFKSDLLLLIQQGTENQVPAKLFEYIKTGKPILAIVSKGATQDLIGKYNLGKIAQQDNLSEIYEALKYFINLEQNQPYKVDNRGNVETFNCVNQTRELAKIFDEITYPAQS
jgi:glycosyltransferase involved in cell wall biosynthesis